MVRRSYRSGNPRALTDLPDLNLFALNLSLTADLALVHAPRPVQTLHTEAGSRIRLSHVPSSLNTFFRSLVRLYCHALFYLSFSRQISFPSFFMSFLLFAIGSLHFTIL